MSEDDRSQEYPTRRAYDYLRNKYDDYTWRCRAAKHTIAQYGRRRREAYGGWEQEKKALAIAAVLLIAIYAVIQGCQLSVIREQERLQLRAYIGMKPTGLDCPSCSLPEKDIVDTLKTFTPLTTPNQLGVEVRNYGQTPARGILGCINWKLVRETDIPNDIMHCDDRGVREFGADFQPGEIVRAFYPADTSDVLAISRIMHGGEGAVYIVGHVTFRDIFNVIHIRPLCWRYFPLQTFYGCPDAIRGKH
jgi:hypothetical protein